MIQQQIPVTFVRPPEAPVYYPTEEEFASPLLYIQSIKPEAERFGICKIVPPKSFKPTFAVNKETFKFKARYQRLSDLDGFSRSRHSFACMLRRFWTDQGWPADLPVPSVGDKYIDWYDLYITVHRMGGHKAVCSTPDGWNIVGRQLGVASFHTAAKELKAIYDKNLLPYDEFRASVEIYLGKDRDSDTRSAPVNKSAGCRRMKKETAHGSPLPSDAGGCVEGSGVSGGSGGVEGKEGVLQETDIPNKEGTSVEKKEDTRKMRARRSQSNVCYSEVVCEVCKETDDFNNLKFCEKCETTYHLRCIPSNVRKDKTKLWLCPKCMKETYDGLRACHTFGFEHTSNLYGLEEFQRNANEFKRKYFGAFNVGLHVVEAEFWRVLGDSNSETVVEYGADLQRGEQGSSGFPTESDRAFLRESEKEYIEHPWNLNKLPDDELSILKHITVQISGMKVPWMYVGMVFSAFCWHTEDHWSASINFVHLGEPKTWYGVPGASAEAFETAFKQLVPILTESNPDLLHQLVTHMNPTVLQAAGIPVYRVDQRAGEFIVTFPRAYHSGFNQGFNFAEAVNFCLADWIPHGRLSINHYSNCKRDLVFSHDELICCMADQANHLHQSIAKSCHADFLCMVEEESLNRAYLVDVGVVLEDEPTLFEFMEDHERACALCHTTLFLSAVRCGCSDDRLACARHAVQLCGCQMSSKRLLYRYTIDDLSHLLSRLLKRSEIADSVDFKQPVLAVPKRVPNGQEGKVPVKRQKIVQTCDSGGPMDFFADGTASTNNELKAVMKMASELVSPSTITRTREATDAPSGQKRWKVSDGESLVTSLLAFPGTGKEVSLVREYLRKYYAMQNDFRMILQTKPEEQNAEMVRRVYDQARSTNIESDDMAEIQQIVQQTEFRERIISALNDQRSTIQTLAEVLQSVDDIFVRTEYMDSMMALLTSLIDEGRNLEIDAENIVTHGNVVTLAEAKELVERADAYPIDLAHIADIRDDIEVIEKLIALLEECKGTGKRVHYSKVRSVLEGQNLEAYDSQGVKEVLRVSRRAAEFLDKLRKLFFGGGDCGQSSSQNLRLMEVLCPRRGKGVKGEVPSVGRGKKKEVLGGKGEERQGGVVGEGGAVTEGCVEEKKHPLDLDLDSPYDFDDLRKLFERACWSEQNDFERIRETNCLKSAIDSDLREECAGLRRDLRWCVCGGQQLGMMIQCDSCFDWFHVSCTRMAEFIHTDGIAEYGVIHHLVESIQFMCDVCQRGVRPPLELLTQLLREYDDVEKFFCIPEMDLLTLVISRAEKWRLSATNVLLELPGIIQAINQSNKTMSQSSGKGGEVNERMRLRLRDTLLAVLLEGNLLEVKVPEWMVLYDFVHENFRKDRGAGAEGKGEGRGGVRQMVLAVRGGRLPFAVDMISPLFRQIGRSFSLPPAPPGPPEPSESTTPPAPPVPSLGGVKRRRGRKPLVKVAPLGGPAVEPSTRAVPSSTQAVPLKSKTDVEVEEPPVGGGKRRRRRQVVVASPDMVRTTRRRAAVMVRENGGLESGVDSPEACSSCHAFAATNSLLSILEGGKVVPMCSDCMARRNARLRRQKSTSVTPSEGYDVRKKPAPVRRHRVI